MKKRNLIITSFFLSLLLSVSFMLGSCGRKENIIEKESSSWTENSFPDNPIQTPTSDDYLEFFLLEDGTYSVRINKYEQHLSIVVFPSEHDGKPVTQIADFEIETFVPPESHEFITFPSLTEIIIPNTVTKIGKNAFMKCTALKEIKIPESVTEIGDFAFSYCDSLEKITYPNGATLGNGAFSHCPLLKNLI